MSSLMAATIAEWIVLIEEGVCNDDGFVLENGLVRKHTLKLVVNRVCIYVEYMQGSVDGTLDLFKAMFLCF